MNALKVFKKYLVIDDLKVSKSYYNINSLGYLNNSNNSIFYGSSGISFGKKEEYKKVVINNTEKIDITLLKE
jgi:hypothetical protein